MVSESAFIFQMCIPCGKTFFLLLKLKSYGKDKVKYQGHIFFFNNGRCGGIHVSQTHLVST